MQKKHIIFGLASIAVIGITFMLIKKHSNKLAAKKAITTTGTIPSTATNPYSNNTAGSVDSNNWDDAGGYRVQQSSGKWNYFNFHGVLQGQGDDAGNWLPAAV